MTAEPQGRGAKGRDTVRERNMPRNGTIDELHNLLERFDTAMLVTVSREGDLRARPMAIAARGETPETLTFVTDIESPKADEVRDEPQSLVTLARGSTFLSLTGEARLEAPSAGRMKALWQPTWRLWFPEGPESAGIALLQFRIRFAEYWDRSGINGVRFFWRATQALSRDAELDDQDLPGHGKVDLARRGNRRG